MQCVRTTCPPSERLSLLPEGLGTFQTAGFTAGKPQTSPDTEIIKELRRPTNNSLLLFSSTRMYFLVQILQHIKVQPAAVRCVSLWSTNQRLRITVKP